MIRNHVAAVHERRFPYQAKPGVRVFRDAFGTRMEGSRSGGDGAAAEHGEQHADKSRAADTERQDAEDPLGRIAQRPEPRIDGDREADEYGDRTDRREGLASAIDHAQAHACQRDQGRQESFDSGH